MVGNGTKYFSGLAGLAIVAAVAYGLLDYRFFGTIVLGAVAIGFLGLMAVTVVAGDSASADRRRQHARPESNAWWPLMAAVGLALLMIGFVVEAVYAFAGMALMAIAGLEWTFSAWSDHYSADPVANKVQRDRLLRPLEAPLFAALLVALPVFLVSRVLLASSRNGASWTAMAVAGVILAFAFLLYAVPDLRRSFVMLGVAIGGLAVVVGGIVALAVGERDFEEHHEEEDHSEEVETAEEGEAAPSPDAPVVIS